MNAKKWITLFLILVSSVITSIYLINYSVDRYSIFKIDYVGLYSEPNQNYVKMNFLLENEHNFDSFIFGSSRVGRISPVNIQNGTYYNMTYSVGLPAEHLENIKLLITNGIKIKNLLIGLDDFSYEVDPIEHLSQPLRLPHYKTEINTMNIFQFYNFYLSKKPSKYDVLQIKNQLLPNKNETTLDFDINNTGIPIVPDEIEYYIENNKAEHNADLKFLKPTHYSGNRITATLSEIKQIIEISKKHDINCTFFINPIHRTTYLDTNFDNFQTFKYELSQLTGYYDFSGLNSITTNNYYYYETSHYRTKVGELIKAKLFKKHPENIPNDFGVYVDKTTIHQHLKYLKNQLEMN